MINICRNALVALITAQPAAVFLSAIVFSFPTLNDLRIFHQNLQACQAEFNLRDIPLHIETE